LLSDVYIVCDTGRGEIIDQFHIRDASLSVVSYCCDLGLISSTDLSTVEWNADAV